MLKRSNFSMSIKDVRTKVRQMLLDQTHNSSDAEIFLSNCKKIRNYFIRLIFFILGIFCLATTVYQIHDRICYFLTIPVISIVITNVNIGKMHPFRLERLPTDELQPFWKLVQNKNDLRCLFSDIIVPYLNKPNIKYSELWAATNMTPHIGKIQIIMENKLFANIVFNNGHIVKQNNSKFLTLEERHTLWGSAIVFKLENLKKEATLSVDLFHSRYCQNPSVTFLVEHLLPYYFFVQLNFGLLVQIKYRKNKNVFLNKRSSPCESDKTYVKKCFDNCLIKKYQQLECRFPFVPIEAGIPDCSKKNIHVIWRTFRQYEEILFSIHPSYNCSCKRSCVEEKLFFSKTSFALNNPKMLSIEYFKMDVNEVEVLQKNNYDIISLLKDIAGSLGLCLGLSLLLIVKLLENSSFYMNKLLQKEKNIGNQLQITVIEKVLIQILETKVVQQKWSKYSKLIIQLILFIISLVLIFQKVIYFSSDPIHTIVEFHENNTIYLPNLIVCDEHDREDEIMTKWKKQYALENNIHFCQVHFLDLLDIKFKAPNIEDLFKINHPKFIKRQHGKYKHYNTLKINTLYGTCNEYIFDPQLYVAMGFFNQILFPHSESCSDKSLLQVFIKDPGTSLYSIYKNQLNVFADTITDIMVETFVLERHNTTKKPCVTSNQYKKCKQLCIENKIKYTDNCRLPLINYINYALCKNGTDAKTSFLNYLKIFLHTDVYTECNCTLQCKEVMYKTHWTYTIQTIGYTQVFVYPFTNTIETLQEIPAYSYISLFCDFGNIFGITLGMSLLSLFKMALTKVVK